MATTNTEWVRSTRATLSPHRASGGVNPPDSIPVSKTTEVGLERMDKTEKAENVPLQIDENLEEGVERKKSIKEKLLAYKKEQVELFQGHVAPLKTKAGKARKKFDEKILRRGSSPDVVVSNEADHHSPPVSPRRASTGAFDPVSSSSEIFLSPFSDMPIQTSHSYSPEPTDQASMAREAVCRIFRKIFQELKNTSFSIEKYSQALEVARQVFDKEDPFLGECLLAWGRLRAELDQMKDARLLYLEARENFIINDKEELIYEVSLAMIETKWKFHLESALEIARSGFFDEPLGYGHDALKVSVKIYGENHNKTALVCLYLADLYNMTKNKRFALEYVERALSILKSPETDHPNGAYLLKAGIHKRTLEFFT